MRVSLGLLITASALVLTNCATSQNNPIYQQTTKYQGSVPTTTMVQQASYETQAPANVQYVDFTSVSQGIPANQINPNHECISKESNRKLFGGATGGIVGALIGRKLAGDNKTIGTLAGAALGGAAGYGIADKTIKCDPIISQPKNVATLPANSIQTYQPTQQSVTIYPASTTNVPTSDTTTDTGFEPNSIEENTNSLGEEGTPGFYAVNGMEVSEDTITEQTDFITEQDGFEYTAPQAVQHTETAPTHPIEVARASLNTRRHTIIPGDTVYSLARSSCVSISDLKTANSINDDFYIRVGDEIMIPLSKCVE